MKPCILSVVRRLVVTLSVMSSSVAVADDVGHVPTVQADNGSSFLTDLLTLEFILPVGVVVLALGVIARKRKLY